MDTLAVQLTLPLAGCVEDFHLQVTQLTTTVSQVALTRNAPCLAHREKSLALLQGFICLAPRPGFEPGTCGLTA